MKRAIFSVLTVFVLIGLTGCITQHGRRSLCDMGGACAQAPEACQSGECDEDCGGILGRMIRCRACRDRGCANCSGGQYANPGPPTGAVAYPYYTVRGPRDFLVDNPPSIGPR